MKKVKLNVLAAVLMTAVMTTVAAPTFAQREIVRGSVGPIVNYGNTVMVYLNNAIALDGATFACSKNAIYLTSNPSTVGDTERLGRMVGLLEAAKISGFTAHLEVDRDLNSNRCNALAAGHL